MSGTNIFDCEMFGEVGGGGGRGETKDGIIWQMPKSFEGLKDRTDELCDVWSWNQRNGR